MPRFTVIRACVGCTAVLLFTACGGGSSSPPPPTVSINVAPSGIPAGQPATLTWSSTNASTCSASGAWTGSQPTSGSLAVSQPAPGTYTYTLSCDASAGSSAAMASAALTVMPAPLAIITATLANDVIGTSYDQTIQATGGAAPFVWTVSNGALPHNLSLSASTTSIVTLSGMPDTVAQGVAFTIQVTDSAHKVATQAYSVSILLQADSLVLSPGSLDFGNQLVGSASGAQTETLTNTATSPVLITGIVPGSSPAEFNQTTTCGASLAAGASCAINVTFTPGQTGPRSAALTITDDTAGSPQSVSLSGVGLTAGPNATLPVSVGFGTQLVGTTSPERWVTLSNYGSATLNVANIAATGSFAETNDCVPSLGSGATCTIRVTFTPGASGDMTGMLSISDDAPGSPQSVSLSGTGSTNTPVLTGYCFATCGGSAKDYAQCPVGQPSYTPGSVPVYPCGPVDGSVRVDISRSCSVRPPHYGHCETQ
jgi:Abnormal spindle-like microcephaly-assoc'd, ASPM-SPD-2-Hydin